ncbi:MAG TPA: SMP-30/gluconolactonase/LRE family protein [Acidimicrobiales bacterium]
MPEPAARPSRLSRSTRPTRPARSGDPAPGATPPWPARTAEPLPAFLDALAGLGPDRRARAIDPRPPPRHPLADVELVADGFALPESPVALDDGSVLLVEIRRGTLDRVTPDGVVEVVCDCGGGPNGVALGPDGAAYVANNGRRHPRYEGGRIEAVDLTTGERRVVADRGGDRPLCRPNDLVFDAVGGCWFTDFGGVAGWDGGPCEPGAILHLAPGAGVATRVLDGLHEPNGIGLSPDGGTLYWAETGTGRAYRRAVTGPGRVAHGRPNDPATLLCGLPGLQLFDSLDVDAHGNVAIATLVSGRITVVAPDGSACVQMTLPDRFADGLVTNLCFAGDGTAYVTLGATGRLVRCRWPDTRALLAGASAAVTARPA